jgi:DNA-binding transcriptional regulator YdaS (Cro superfamily)
VQNLNTINKLMVHFGGQYKLALALNVSSAAVSLWVKEAKIPPLRAIQIEKITNGKFRARDLIGE